MPAPKKRPAAPQASEPAAAPQAAPVSRKKPAAVPPQAAPVSSKKPPVVAKSKAAAPTRNAALVAKSKSPAQRSEATVAAGKRAASPGPASPFEAAKPEAPVAAGKASPAPRKRKAAVETDNWYHRPAWYDLAFRSETEPEVDFFEAAFRKYAVGPVRSVLEPACGTGRLIVELAARGYEPVGFDLSLPALAYLRRKLARRKLRGAAFAGDMAEFVVPSDLLPAPGYAPQMPSAQAFTPQAPTVSANPSPAAAEPSLPPQAAGASAVSPQPATAKALSPQVATARSLRPQAPAVSAVPSPAAAEPATPPRGEGPAALPAQPLAASSVPADGLFDAACCTFDGFRHLLDEGSARRHLECVAEAVRPGGIYILGFHLLPPDADETCTERWTEKHGGTQVTVTLRVVASDRATRVERLRISLLVRQGDATHRLRDEFPLRLYEAAQVRSLLASVPAWELLDVFDFWYEIDHPLALDDEISDTVLILRRR